MQALSILCVSLMTFMSLLITLSEAHDYQQFSLALYRAVAKTVKADQNIAISPFSVDAALCMTYIGAAGTTKSELATALGIEANETASSLAADFKSVTSSGQNFTFQTANALFLDKTFVILPQYQSEIANDFGGNITSVDFANAADPVRKQINAYVASKTSDKIKDLLPENSVDSDTRSVLVNAAYFKAEWDKIFDPKKTSLQPFTLANGEQKNVMMMAQKARFGHIYIDGPGPAQLVELRYKGLEASMVILLPGRKPSMDEMFADETVKLWNETSMADLEAHLTPEKLNDAMKRLFRSAVPVIVPKFKLNIASKLVDALQTMGIKEAFTGSAEFPEISQEPISITNAAHKVFIEVDEKGTTAAAATAIENGQRSGSMPILIDRPFLFLVRHVQSKAILFMGRVSDPTVEQ